ncbi:MAG: hypothetical protein JNJ95_09880 [Dechloromonas sp.]|nr:hypothetical protein [Dechloromonas sp.]
MSLHVIIDIEASGYGRGNYPIEIGYCMPGSSVHGTRIRPEPVRIDWETLAEAAHGIASDQLASHGQSAFDACRALNQNLAGQHVYCDGRSHDHV